MKIYLASDHAGFSLKELIKKFLEEKNFSVVDCGAFTFDKDDDYPDFISKAAKAVSEGFETKAIIFGGSGQAEMMVANKYPNVRAALFYGPVKLISAGDVTGKTSEDPFEIVRLTRIHNDANILSIGARFVNEDDCKKAVDIWLNTAFLHEARHKRRIEKLKSIEKIE